MKAILAIALFVAVVSAQVTQYCVHLDVNDVTCEGHRDNFPTKVCSTAQNSNYSSATACDATQFFNPYGLWQGLCPVKNVDNETFCMGTGYSSPYTLWSTPCFALRGCAEDDDCNVVAEPQAPVAPPPLACFDCCLFCFDNDTCVEKVASNDTYTDAALCTPCAPAEPVAAPVAGEPQSGAPSAPTSTTPSAVPRATPRAAGAASIVASASVLIVAAAALFA